MVNCSSGRSLRGNVDRNDVTTLPTVRMSCRSLRGNVDRNFIKYHVRNFGILVVPYVGTWIEIIPVFDSVLMASVVPYVGTWIEIGGGRSGRV